MRFILLSVLILFFCFHLGISQNLEDIAKEKMDSVELLIQDVEALGIDASKERMTLRVSEVFLDYANWDENHIAENAGYFELVSIYKNNAAQLAQDLPDFERYEVVVLLKDAISRLKKIKEGEISRTDIPDVDWSQVSLNGDHLLFENRPVFLADYTWKPDIPQLTEYFGELDGFFITPSYVINENGDINPNILQNLRQKEDGTAGFIFIAQKNPPQWSIDKYGPGFDTFKGEPFHDYDIDNPGAKDLMSKLLGGTVPLMAGKKYTELGYMLCNEPRWITYKDGAKKVWYNGGVSDYTIEKFKIWLENKHNSIDALNALWGTNFASFEDVSIEIPIDISLQGTPKWYDWSTFNDYRVLEWFKWMKSEIRKHDPDAKVHLKIMPSFFTDNEPCTGINLEALTEMSDIIGNDVAAKNNHLLGETPWDDHYAFDWRELYMAYDFLKSINPEQIIFNSESHLLSTSKSRDLYLDPDYVRATFWGAHTLGLSASQIWYWPRREDGSLRAHNMSSYSGTNNQQPRVTNEIHSTMMDLNSFSEEILAMQRQKKPVRIYYSKTSATNQRAYMDDVFNLYESLNFEGVSLGFATKNIIASQNNNNWDVITIYKTPFVTDAEFNRIQTYLNNGGTVIIDKESLLRNEYGFQRSEQLSAVSGRLIEVSSLADMKDRALQIVEEHGDLPSLSISETNTGGHKGCVWKCIENEEGNYVLSIINLGKTDAELDISLKDAEVGTACRDLILDIPVSPRPVLAPYEVYFVEVTDAKSDVGIRDLFKKKSESADLGVLFPNPTNGDYVVALEGVHPVLRVMVFNQSGMMVSNKKYLNCDKIEGTLRERNDGLYLVYVLTVNGYQVFKVTKRS